MSDDFRRRVQKMVSEHETEFSSDFSGGAENEMGVVDFTSERKAMAERRKNAPPYKPGLWDRLTDTYEDVKDFVTEGIGDAWDDSDIKETLFPAERKIGRENIKKGYDVLHGADPEFNEIERQATIGVGEGALGITTGMAAMSASGIAGIAELMPDEFMHENRRLEKYGKKEPRTFDERLRAAGKTIEDVSQKYTYQPRGAAGQYAMVENPLAKVFEGLAFIGDKGAIAFLEKFPEQPEIAALIATIPEAVAILLGAKKITSATKKAIMRYRNRDAWRMKNIHERGVATTTIQQLMDSKNPRTGKNYTIREALAKASDKKTVQAEVDIRLKPEHPITPEKPIKPKTPPSEPPPVQGGKPTPPVKPEPPAGPPVGKTPVAGETPVPLVPPPKPRAPRPEPPVEPAPGEPRPHTEPEVTPPLEETPSAYFDRVLRQHTLRYEGKVKANQLDRVAVLGTTVPEITIERVGKQGSGKYRVFMGDEVVSKVVDSATAKEIKRRRESTREIKMFEADTTIDPAIHSKLSKEGFEAIELEKAYENAKHKAEAEGYYPMMGLGRFGKGYSVDGKYVSGSKAVKDTGLRKKSKEAKKERIETYALEERLHGSQGEAIKVEGGYAYKAGENDVIVTGQKSKKYPNGKPFKTKKSAIGAGKRKGVIFKGSIKLKKFQKDALDGLIEIPKAIKEAGGEKSPLDNISDKMIKSWDGSTAPDAARTVIQDEIASFVNEAVMGEVSKLTPKDIKTPGRLRGKIIVGLRGGWTNFVKEKGKQYDMPRREVDARIEVMMNTLDKSIDNFLPGKAQGDIGSSVSETTDYAKAREKAFTPEYSRYQSAPLNKLKAQEKQLAAKKPKEGSREYIDLLNIRRMIKDREEKLPSPVKKLIPKQVEAANANARRASIREANKAARKAAAEKKKQQVKRNKEAVTKGRRAPVKATALESEGTQAARAKDLAEVNYYEFPDGKKVRGQTSMQIGEKLTKKQKAQVKQGKFTEGFRNDKGVDVPKKETMLDKLKGERGSIVINRKKGAKKKKLSDEDRQLLADIKAKRGGKSYLESIATDKVWKNETKAARKVVGTHFKVEKAGGYNKLEGSELTADQRNGLRRTKRIIQSAHEEIVRVAIKNADGEPFLTAKIAEKALKDMELQDSHRVVPSFGEAGPRPTGRISKDTGEEIETTTAGHFIMEHGETAAIFDRILKAEGEANWERTVPRYANVKKVSPVTAELNQNIKNSGSMKTTLEVVGTQGKKLKVEKQRYVPELKEVAYQDKQGVLKRKKGKQYDILDTKTGVMMDETYDTYRGAKESANEWNGKETVERGANWIPDALANDIGASRLIGGAAATLAKGVRKIFDIPEAIDRVFSIDTRFKHKGQETGFHVKTFHGERAIWEDRSYVKAKELGKIIRKNLNVRLKSAKGREALADVVLAAESKSYYESLDPKYRKALEPAVTIMRDFFDRALDEYKSRGVEGIDFVENAKAKINKKLAEEVDLEKIAKLQKALRHMEGIEFVHIPGRLWFTAKGRRMVNFKGQNAMERLRRAKDLYVAKYRRSVPSIGDLLLVKDHATGKYIINKTDINPFEIMLDYGQIQGSDFAHIAIRDAAVKDGLAVKSKSKPKSKSSAVYEISAGGKKIITKDAMAHEWVQVAGSNKQYSAWNGYWIDKQLADTITNVMSVDNLSSRTAKFISYYKMLQFSNPWFMTYYNFEQAAFKGGLSTHPIKWAKALYKAKKDVMLNTPDLIEARHNGMLSQPFANPFSQVPEQVSDLMGMTKIKPTNPAGIAVDLIKQGLDMTPGWIAGRNQVPILNGIYHGLWTSAWGMDKYIRMGTYNYFRGHKYSPRESAQITANLHADYANVPAALRKRTNLAMFTPTFTISMIRSEIRGVAEAARIGTGRKTKGAEKAVKRALAKSLIYMGMYSLAIHLWMTSNGWEMDVLGQKYHKEVDIPGEGIVRFSKPSPILKTLNYAMKIRHAMSPGKKNKLSGLFRVARNMTTPILRNVANLIDNRTPQGGTVYNEFDPTWKQWADSLDFFAGESSKLYKQVSGRGERFSGLPKDAREMVEADIDAFTSFMEKAGIGYLSIGRSERVVGAAQINGLLRQYAKDIKNLVKSGSDPDEVNRKMVLWRKDLDDRIEKIQREMEE